MATILLTAEDLHSYLKDIENALRLMRERHEEAADNVLVALRMRLEDKWLAALREETR